MINLEMLKKSKKEMIDKQKMLEESKEKLVNVI
jgi:hypothetical protein